MVITDCTRRVNACIHSHFRASGYPEEEQKVGIPDFAGMKISFLPHKTDIQYNTHLSVSSDQDYMHPHLSPYNKNLTGISPTTHTADLYLVSERKRPFFEKNEGGFALAKIVS